jgi:hypothetical protein
MSKFRALIAGVLLSGLSLACSGGRIVQARQDAPQTQRINSVAVRPAGEPLRPEWKVAAPARFKNLTVIPVTSDDCSATDQFITLDQGLQSGTVTITEFGADGHTRSLRPGEQADDNAEVNKLSITNRSGKLLVLIAGEILSGGKQDRIVGSDRIVKPDNSPMPPRCLLCRARQVEWRAGFRAEPGRSRWRRWWKRRGDRQRKRKRLRCWARGGWKA